MLTRDEDKDTILWGAASHGDLKPFRQTYTPQCFSSLPSSLYVNVALDGLLLFLQARNDYVGLGLPSRSS